MKKREFQELKNKSSVELQRDLANYREELRKLKFDLPQGKVKNVMRIRELRKTVAKILTLTNIKK